MKPLLNVFRKFNEIDLGNSRFSFNYDSVGFYTGDGSVLVYLAGNYFEVLSERE